MKMVVLLNIDMETVILFAGLFDELKVQKSNYMKEIFVTMWKPLLIAFDQFNTPLLKY